jgi:hypothetical protein
VQHLEFTSSVAEDRSSDMQCCITGQVVPIVSKDPPPLFVGGGRKTVLDLCDLEYIGTTVHENISNHLPNDTVSHPRRCKSSILVVAFDGMGEELKGISEF